MTISIRSNATSLVASRQLSSTTQSLERTLTRLSSGSRINSAADDSAGLALSTALRTRAQVFQQGVRNANDAVSLLNIAQDAIENLSTLTDRLKELAVQAANGVATSSQRRALDEEAMALTNEFNRIIGSARYNKRQILTADSGSIGLQLGYGTSGAIQFDGTSEFERALGTGSVSSTVISAGNGNTDSAIGDFNGDGNLDVVGVSALGTSVSLTYGNGAGAFPTSGTESLSSSPFSVVTGDFNGDGHTDFAAGLSNGSVDLMLNDGTGGFNRKIVALGGAAVTDLAVADLNGDGLDDLLAGAGSLLTPILQIQGGEFTTAAAINNINNIGSLAVGDFDGDGDADIATTNTSNLILRTFQNSGNGTFSASMTTTVAVNAELAAGDLNRDGISDLVTGHGHILIATGNGIAFTSDTSFTPTATSGKVAIADMNGDGYLDIAKIQSSSFDFFAGNGTASVGGRVATSVQFIAPSSINIGDFNGDGVGDLQYGMTFAYVRLSQTIPTTEIAHLDLRTRAGALAALESLESTSGRISKGLGGIGAALSRIESAIRHTSRSAEEHLASASRITDADIATESAELVRLQILRDASTAILAQANQQPALALALLGADVI